jgi:hypothetical protein
MARGNRRLSTTKWKVVLGEARMKSGEGVTTTKTQAGTRSR